MVRWTAAVMAGSLCALLWPGWPTTVGLLAATFGAAAWVFPPLRYPLGAAVIAALWASLVAAYVLSNRVPEPVRGAVRGCVTSGVWLDGGRVRFALAAASFDDRPVRWHLELTAYQGVRVPAPGECWVFQARLRPARGLLNPDGADAERRAFVRRVSGRGVAVLDRTAARIGHARGAALLRFRLMLADQLRFLIGEGETWPLLVALAVGFREPMPQRIDAALAATGTRHLVSISGLHIGLVAAFGWWLGRAVAAPLARAFGPRAWVRSGGDVQAGPAGALVAAVTYAALAGFALPTLRALIMLTVWLAVRRRQRRIGLATTLAAAALVLLVVDPLVVLDIGFYLSFGAVAALGTLGLRDGRGALRAQWIAFVGLWPVLAAGLGRLALFSPLANAVWVPLFSVIVVPGVLSGLLLLVAPLDVGVAWFAGLTGVVDKALEWLIPLGQLPAAHLHLPAVRGWPLMLALPGVALLLIPKAGLRERCLALALCLPLALGRAERPDYGQVHVQVFDVSHGLAVAVHTRHHTVLYDAGGRWGRSDAGARIVIPQLAASGVRRLHTLVVSHGDLDHRGGAASVLASLPAAAVLAGEPQRGRRGAPCRAGQRWRLDGVMFEMLHPAPSARWRGNNASCVLQVTARHGRLLLTGDLEALGEMSLVYRGRVGPQTVVVGQHHGSKTSSSQAFVGTTSPALAVFSTAYANRWGLPADAVTDRWHAVGAWACSTAALGAIEFELSGADVLTTMMAARTRRPALWRWTPGLSKSGWKGAFRVRTGRDILRASC